VLKATAEGWSVLIQAKAYSLSVLTSWLTASVLRRPKGGAMNPIVDRVARWREEGKRAAIATVVKVERSGPLGAGTSMAVSEDGQVVGSVSGGCVEPAVFEEAMGAIETGEPKLLSYGISDDEAFGVGLTCGGVIHIFVERVDW
jgi:xanthine dehydrogenase accessory factor